MPGREARPAFVPAPARQGYVGAVAGAQWGAAASGGGVSLPAMSLNPEAQSFLIAVGLVIVGIFGVVVVWEITKSLFKLAF